MEFLKSVIKSNGHEVQLYRNGPFYTARSQMIGVSLFTGSYISYEEADSMFAELLSEDSLYS